MSQNSKAGKNLSNLINILKAIKSENINKNKKYLENNENSIISEKGEIIYF